MDEGSRPILERLMDAEHERVHTDPQESDVVIVRDIVSVSGPAFMDVWPRWRAISERIRHVTIEPRLADDGGLAFYRRLDDTLEYLFGIPPDEVRPWTVKLYHLACGSPDPAEFAAELRIAADRLEKGE